MIHMVQNAKDQAAALAMAAYQAAVADGTLPQAEVKPLPWRPPSSCARHPGISPRPCWAI